MNYDRFQRVLYEYSYNKGKVLSGITRDTDCGLQRTKKPAEAGFLTGV